MTFKALRELMRDCVADRRRKRRSKDKPSEELPESTIDKEIKRLNFYRWLFCGTGGKCGLAYVLNWAVAVHLLIGFGLHLYVPSRLDEAAASAILPLASILIGLVFAWSGNAQALLQQPEIEAISNHNKGGLADWVFQYQLAVLVLLLALVVWGLTAMNVSVSSELGIRGSTVTAIERTALFGATSLALWECWSVISSAGKLLILRKFVIDRTSPSKAGNSDQVTHEHKES
ncbi:MAG: hypothetical protein BroJett014_32590 [Planctomycetota bacterium]|nr:hypothetical protein [Planctomycetota bacterium]GIK54286.1 MAG: hypothetical protein BroJett014_32590 [Planctomycetota bacterium]